MIYRPDYFHFARIQNGIVVSLHVFDPDNLGGNRSDEFIKQYLAGIHGKNAESFINCLNGGNEKGIYPEIGDSYLSDDDIFVKNSI